jgi:hypothetical protein
MPELQNPVQKIWQEQPVEGIKMSAEVIHQRAAKFERRIRWRNRRESVGCLVVSGLFTYFLFDTHDVLFRVAYGLFIAAMIWIAIQLQRKGSVKSLPAGLEASSSLQFFRQELERQRDAVKNVWPWYLAPMVPGYVMLTIAYLVSFPHPARWIGVAAFDLFVVLLFIGIWKMNQRAARCLQRSIDELNAAE